MTQTTKILPFFFLFTVTGWTQVNIFAAMSYDQYGDDINYSSTPGFNFGASYKFQSGIVAGLQFQDNNVNQKINTPVGTGLILTKVNDFVITLSYPVSTNFYAISFRPVVGIGVKFFKRGAYSFRLGALGTQSLAATTEGFYMANMALNLSHKIYKQVALFLQPQISFYDFKNLNRVYTIAGGIHVRIY